MLGEEEWSKRIEEMKKDEREEEEEEAILAVPEEEFHTKAHAFIRKRLEENSKVVSLNQHFIVLFVDRCIAQGVDSSLLRLLLQSNINIAINPHVLDAILKEDDITTLLYFLNYLPVISEADLVKILEYMLTVPDQVIKSFAEQNHWEGEDRLRELFLVFCGPQLIRVKCEYATLRKKLAVIDLDVVYSAVILMMVGKCE